jgi:hypothetical protein
LEHDDDVIEAVKMEEDLEDNDGTLNNARAASAPKIIIDRCNVDLVDDVEILMERRVINNHIMARHDDAGVVRVDFLIIIIVKLLLLLVLLLLCIRLTSTQIKGCNRVR